MDRARVGTLVLVAGLVVAAHPVYLGLHPGDTTVDVRAEPADVADVSEDRIADASDLPGPTQDALVEAVEDGEATRWRVADRGAVDPLVEHDFVRLDGETYRVRVFADEGLLGHVDTVVSPLVALVGVLGVFVGARTFWDAHNRDS
ncbi:hypothetical protein [Haloarchaeobius sp. HRN-SO-5]|uniref:hypothetical protein n=1 Tax=Haloarchaeobius sp. HRN-SO-5 TaxID=3446118 RepID=UPI003EB6F00B